MPDPIQNVGHVDGLRLNLGLESFVVERRLCAAAVARRDTDGKRWGEATRQPNRRHAGPVLEMEIGDQASGAWTRKRLHRLFDGRARNDWDVLPPRALDPRAEHDRVVFEHNNVPRWPVHDLYTLDPS